MANYVNRLVDPAEPQQQSLNNLMGVAQFKMGQERNQMDRQRLGMQQEQLGIQKEELGLRQEKQSWERLEIPFAYTKMKTHQMSQIAKNIMGLPAPQRTAKYNDLMTKVAPMPITTHPQLGLLGVFNPDNFLSPESFAALSDEQQQQYLELVAFTSDDIAKLKLSDANAKAKVDEINLNHSNKLKEITHQKNALIEVEGVKQEGRLAVEQEKTAGDLEVAKTKGTEGGGADKVQNRIDKYRKEVAGLASVRERIRKGDDLYQLGQMMAQMSGKKNLAIGQNSNVDDALKKVDEYERWLRVRLRELEGEDEDDNPLGLDLD